MLDNYCENQPIAYKILTNSINKDKLAHAYLIDANGYSNKLDFALSFAKFIICSHHKTDNTKCKNCYICKRIDNRNFIDLKIIEADGLWIKKEQLENLQQEFSEKAIESSKKVYIINDAEKLNASASNSILKFLEEPEANIVAILVTNNIYQLLDTIISRCQIVPLKREKLTDEIKNIDCTDKTLVKIAAVNTSDIAEINNIILSADYKTQVETAINFVKAYEKSGKQVLLNMTDLWNKALKDKETILFGLDIMILYYKDVLNMKINRPLEIFDDYQTDIENLVINNTSTLIAKKIKVIIDAKNKVKYNVNNNLLMDKLIIDLEEVKHE